MVMAAEEHPENEENSEKPLKRKHANSALDNFSKLTNGVENTRIKAGVELLKHLTRNTDPNQEELKHALARLVRGLGSSKIQAKTGFFVTLVGLLNLKTITFHEIFEHVSKELHKGSGNSKTENADISFGKILICGAIMRSNLYQSLAQNDKIKVLELLIDAGKERTYLTLASYKFLQDLFIKIDTKEFKKSVYPVIKNELSKSMQEQDLDGLFLLLQVEKYFPKVLGATTIFGPENLSDVCNVITTIPRHSALKHPVFDHLIEKLSETDFIIDFFQQLDQTLAKPNRNKHLAVTNLLIGTIKNLKDDKSILPDLLTNNYIRQTLNTYRSLSARNKDREFQESTHKLFEIVLDALKTEIPDEIRITVLRKLLFNPGTFIFEKITRSKLVQNITGTLNSGGVKILGGDYRDVILAAGEKVVRDDLGERWANLDRVYASHLLIKLLSHPSMQKESDWKIEQLTFLMKLGLFKDDNIGGELSESFRDAFYSSLNLKLAKLEEIRTILSSVVRHLDEIVDESNYETLPRRPLTRENYETWRQTVEILSKLESHTKKKRNTVFHILFLHLALQLFNDSKLASDSLMELFSCYERSKKSKDEVKADDPLWIEVVIDLFLNLLSHNSHLLRSVVNYVFPYLCKYVNGDAIRQILDALDPKNESNPLSKSNEDEEDDDSASEESSEEEEEEDDDDDDDENVNDKLRLALQQVLGANQESDAESVDLDNLDEEAGEELDRALGEAFKQFKPNLGRRNKQKKDDETLMHFRIRVLDLVEIYLNSNPSMMLTLEIMLPLLQMLEFCIRDEHQKPLKARIDACLKKLCSSKKFADWEEVNEDVLVDLLKSLLEKGTKNPLLVQEMEEKLADCCVFIINCSQIVGAKRKIKKVIAESLEAFFKRRDCIIPYVLFKNVVRLNWYGNFKLVPLLSAFVFSKDVRMFKRSQALVLLKLFFNNNRLITSNPEKVETASFLNEALEFFREISTNSNEGKVKEKFVSGLLELLTCIKNGVLQKSFEEWGVLGECVREFRSRFALSGDAKGAFNKFCKSLNISNIVQMKKETIRLNDVEEEEMEDGEKKTKRGDKKKKKGVSKDKLKLKKETKELRLMSLSDGFGKRKIDWEGDEESKKIKVV